MRKETRRESLQFEAFVEDGIYAILHHFCLQRFHREEEVVRAEFDDHEGIREACKEEKILSTKKHAVKMRPVIAFCFLNIEKMTTSLLISATRSRYVCVGKEISYFRFIKHVRRTCEALWNPYEAESCFQLRRITNFYQKIECLYKGKTHERSDEVKSCNIE